MSFCVVISQTAVLDDPCKLFCVYLAASGNLPAPCFRCRHRVCLGTGMDASLRYFRYDPLLLDGPELGVDSITSRSR